MKMFRWLVALLVVVLLLFSSLVHGAIRRVDPTSPTNGPGTLGDWSNAYHSLTDALAASPALQAGDEVHVAGGTYKPASQSSSIELKAGVSIQGGYAGYNTPNPDARVETSIFSGDIGTNPGDVDGLNFTNRSDNAYHVVLSPSTVTPPNPSGTGHGPEDFANLDGFTIRGGESFGDTVAGGGIRIVESNPVIRDCIITDNRASGVFCNRCSDSPTLRKCHIFGNSANSGGGVFTNSTCNIIDCEIYENTTSSLGGGIAIVKGEEEIPLILNVINCTVRDNTAVPGAGSILGGGIYMDPDFPGTATILNCLIAENIADGGGGIFAADMTTSIKNCTIANNNGGTAGGGVSDFGGTTYVNSIIWGNVASNLGSQIWSVSAPVSITYCDVENGTFGGTNIDADPIFEDDDNGDYRLTCGSPPSPCINAGLDSAVPDDTADVDENPSNDGDATPDRDLAMRIISSVDMGAYEKQYVTCPGDATGDGLIDTDDLLMVINNWDLVGPAGPDGDIAPGPCGDSAVNTDDLLAVINNWGACDAPSSPPQSVSDCFGVCSQLTGEDWQKCMNACLEAIEE